MASHFDDTIGHYLKKLSVQEKGVADTKRIINSLCEDAGRAPMFATVESTDTPELTTIKSDSFYGQPLATVATMYLKMRRASNMGPAKITEIYAALKSGGFVFDAVNEDYAKRGLRNSL